MRKTFSSESRFFKLNLSIFFKSAINLFSVILPLAAFAPGKFFSSSNIGGFAAGNYGKKLLQLNFK